MTDAATRKLEREVETAGDDPSRFSLTRQYIRNKQGTLLWWRADYKPHVSAARVCLSYDTTCPLTKQVKTVDTPGWAVAVPSVADLFDFASRSRHATAIDLATGKWLMLHGRRSWAEAENARCSELVTTQDALGRPRSSDAPRPTWQTTPRDNLQASESWQSTARASLSRSQDEPIYDSELLDVDRISSQTSLFVNFSSFGTYFHDSPQKQWGLHTNLYGDSSLPASYLHESTGLTVELSTLDGRRVSDEFLSWFRSSFYVRFRLVHRDLINVPASLVTTNVESDTQDSMRIEGLAPPPVYPFLIPIHLDAHEQFRVELFKPGSTQAPSAILPRQAVVKVLLSGFMWRGVTS